MVLTSRTGSEVGRTARASMNRYKNRGLAVEVLTAKLINWLLRGDQADLPVIGKVQGVSKTRCPRAVSLWCT
jgi:hypothetical protein